MVLLIGLNLLCVLCYLGVKCVFVKMVLVMFVVFVV